MTIYNLRATLKSNGISKVISLLLTPLVVSGCAQRNTTPPDAAKFALPPDSSTKHKGSTLSPSAATGRTSQDSLLPANWSTIAASWLKSALQAPDSKAASKVQTQQVVTINVATLAARHPAWQLADALQREQAVLFSRSLLLRCRARLVWSRL